MHPSCDHPGAKSWVFSPYGVPRLMKPRIDLTSALARRGHEAALAKGFALPIDFVTSTNASTSPAGKELIKRHRS
jgi:hypothetical protein